MYATELKLITCPYCGEQIDVVIDTSLDQQQYIEDCKVCCCPVTLNVTIYHDTNESHFIDVQAMQEND